MKESNKIRLGWLAFVFVCAHFFLVICYAFPAGYLSSPLKNAASWYAHPFFEQTWALFAPAPVIDQHMEVRYFFGADSTEWFDPAAGAAEMHAMLRFTHHGDLVLGQSNLLFWVASDLETMGLSLYKPFPADSASAFRNTGSFLRLRNYLHGNAAYFYDRQPDSAGVKCYFENVVTGDSGSIELPQFSWEP